MRKFKDFELRLDIAIEDEQLYIYCEDGSGCVYDAPNTLKEFQDAVADYIAGFFEEEGVEDED